MKMLMKIALPKMGEFLVMMMTMISPSGRGSSPGRVAPLEGKSDPAKFRLKTAVLRPECPPLIFFLGQNDLYTRRWAPKVGRGG